MRWSAGISSNQEIVNDEGATNLTKSLQKKFQWEETQGKNNNSVKKHNNFKSMKPVT